LLAVGAGFSVFNPGTAEYVGFIGLVVGLTVAATLLVRRSRKLADRERRAWRWIATALALIALGVLAVGLLSGIGVDLPAFGALDVFFLAAYAALVVGLYRLMRLDSGDKEWVLSLVDTLVGGIALVALVWNWVFHDLVTAMTGAPVWEAAIATSYPVLDVIIVVGLLLLVIRRSNYYLDLRLVFLAIGASSQVLADFVFLKRGVGESFATAEPAWVLNLFALMSLLVMASIVDRVPHKREFPEAPTPIWALIWPYLLAASLLVVHVGNYRDLNPGSNETLLLDAVIAIGVVILFRQVYVIYRDRNRVDRKRAELVASVSHELRTPLTAMVGFLTLLDDHPDEFPMDARQEMISDATEQARHMSRLVADLLMLAKGDTSQLSLEVQEVRAMSIVNSVLRNTETAGTRIDQELDAEVLVRIDPDRVKQALGNLVTNAVRYGGDQCLVVAKVVGRDLTFEIHDSGDGVPTKFEAVIWHHFERGAHRLDAVTPGLGIGLSIVQAVAESHGGRAEYRVSERLGGACFSLTIPGCVVADEPARTRISVGS
jgi:signal transduction histidine kinase